MTYRRPSVWGVDGVLGDTADQGGHGAVLRCPGGPLEAVLVGVTVVHPRLVVHDDLPLHLEAT